VTIKYDKTTSKYYLNIVFEKECIENKEFSNIMAIDLGFKFPHFEIAINL